MRGDKDVAGADSESAANPPINLEVGLFRIWNGTVPIRVAIPDISRGHNAV